MKALKKQIGILAIAAASVAGGFFGYNAIENVQFANAQEQVQATKQQLAQVEDLATVFRHVGKVVEPSVVNIQVTKTIKGMGGRMHMFDEDMLRRLFPDQDGDGQPDLPPGFNPGRGNNGNGNGGDGGDDEGMVQMGTGSGVIMEVSGGNAYILTNNHVAGGAEKMSITLADGRVVEDGKLVGADPKSDIAVVKIKADRVMHATWGNSDDLQKGDWIMAFGSPFGYVGSMTHGIVSALHRNEVGILGQNGYENFIQVDAPINPGNSGGPLVNIRGEVVGINTAIASRSGGFQGIGFAIPSNQAKYIYQSLKDTGKVARGWLGVGIRPISADPDLAKSFGYEGTKGAFVDQTFANTPASGKLKEGDIITSVNGKEVEDSVALRNAIAEIKPGQTANLKVFRDGKNQEVAIKLGEQPDNPSVAMRGGPGGKGRNGNGDSATPETSDTFGLTLQSLDNQTMRKLGLGGTGVKSGAVITHVDPQSGAARKGLRPGDVITRVGNTTVNNAEEATAALSKADPAKGVRLYVASPEGSRFVFVPAEKKATTKDSEKKE
jgi:serine protease Do